MTKVKDPSVRVLTAVTDGTLIPVDDNVGTPAAVRATLFNGVEELSGLNNVVIANLLDPLEQEGRILQQQQDEKFAAVELDELRLAFVSFNPATETSGNLISATQEGHFIHRSKFGTNPIVTTYTPDPHLTGSFYWLLRVRDKVSIARVQVQIAVGQTNDHGLNQISSRRVGADLYVFSNVGISITGGYQNTITITVSDHQSTYKLASDAITNAAVAQEVAEGVVGTALANAAAIAVLDGSGYSKGQLDGIVPIRQTTYLHDNMNSPFDVLSSQIIYETTDSSNDIDNLNNIENRRIYVLGDVYEPDSNDIDITFALSHPNNADFDFPTQVRRVNGFFSLDGKFNFVLTLTTEALYSQTGIKVTFWKVLPNDDDRPVFQAKGTYNVPSSNPTDNTSNYDRGINLTLVLPVPIVFLPADIYYFTWEGKFNDLSWQIMTSITFKEFFNG